MTGRRPVRRSGVSTWVLGVFVPIALIGLILSADALEGPKTAYVGVLAVVPMLGAVFGTPWTTALVAAITWLSGYAFGLVASDGNVPAQTVRLVIILIMSAIAIAAAGLRMRREEQLAAALVLAAQAEQMREQALTDPLTSLLNRRGLLAALESWGAPRLSVALLDMDGLKQVNDTHGHLVGDECIRGVAGIIRANVQADDPVGRWGGDEFLVLLPLDQGAARGVIDRVVGNLADRNLDTAVGPIRVGVSAGVAEREDGETIDQVLARADAELYRAKR